MASNADHPQTQSRPVVVPREGKVLVTGATGHVGANLVHRLLEQGESVRCLVQPGSNDRALTGLDIERVDGDVRDADAVRRAVAGTRRVFHVAAKVSTHSPGPKKKREIWDINVGGTKHVLEAALREDVARVCLTGSFAAVGFDPDDPAKASHEDQPFFPFVDWHAYAHTKVLAELETLRATARGLDTVIATSTGVIGPYDYLPSRMGRVLCEFANGKLRAYIDGGIDFVSARDLADGHILAMTHGRRGEKYTISTEFATLEQVLDTFGEICGRPNRLMKLPPGLMSGIASVYYGIMSRAFPDTPQRLTPSAVMLLRMHRRASIDKARRELGYQPTSLREALRQAFEFFAAEGMIRSGARAAARAPSPDASSGPDIEAAQ